MSIKVLYTKITTNPSPVEMVHKMRRLSLLQVTCKKKEVKLHHEPKWPTWPELYPVPVA